MLPLEGNAWGTMTCTCTVNHSWICLEHTYQIKILQTRLLKTVIYRFFDAAGVMPCKLRSNENVCAWYTWGMDGATDSSFGAWCDVTLGHTTNFANPYGIAKLYQCAYTLTVLYNFSNEYRTTGIELTTSNADSTQVCAAWRLSVVLPAETPRPMIWYVVNCKVLIQRLGYTCQSLA